MESLIRTITLLALFSATGIAQGLTFKTIPHVAGADTNSEEGLSITKGGVIFLDFIARNAYQSAKLYPTGLLPIKSPTAVFIGRNFSNARNVGGIGFSGNQTVGILIKGSTGQVITYWISGYHIIAGGAVNDLCHRVVTVRSPVTNIFSGALRDNVGRVTILNAPGAISTWAESINNSDDIVGEWFDTSVSHGFLWHAGEFTTIDVPGALQTFCNGIGNNGWIVGNYIDGIDPTNHAFLYKDGQFIKFDFPVPPGTGLFFTKLNGVNESGVMVGTYLITNPALENGIERFAFTATLQ